MTQDSSSESDVDTDVLYIKTPYSSLIIAARLMDDSNLSDDVRIEFFAITTGSQNGACADEVGGRHGTTVGNNGHALTLRLYELRSNWNEDKVRGIDENFLDSIRRFKQVNDIQIKPKTSTPTRGNGFIRALFGSK